MLQVGKNRILCLTRVTVHPKARSSKNTRSAGRRLSEQQGPLCSGRCSLIESRIIEHRSGSKPRLSMHRSSRASGL